MVGLQVGDKLFHGLDCGCPGLWLQWPTPTLEISKTQSGWRNALLIHTVKENDKTLLISSSNLVQGSYRNLADIIRDVVPGGALRVTGGHALSVPQVFWTGNSHAIKIVVTTKINMRCGVSLPFSSTACTEVRPTDTCFSFCLAGDGMWYQLSPVARYKTQNIKGCYCSHFQSQSRIHWPAGFCGQTEPL